MLIAWVVSKKHLFNAIEFSRSLSDTAASRAGHEHMNRRPDCKSRGEAFSGCIIQNMVVVLGEQQRRHHSTPASFFSFPTRSSTEVTLIPACLLEGSTVLMTLRRDFVSTPSASGVVSSSGFFLAFMMLGRPGITRLVEAQVGRYDRGDLQNERLKAAINLPCDREASP